MSGIQAEEEVILPKEELIKLAGYLEGEGYFGTWPTCIQVSTTDKDVAEWAASVMRLDGKVQKYVRSDPACKTVWKVSVSGERAFELMALLLPEMIGERRKARIRACLELRDSRRPLTTGPRGGE